MRFAYERAISCSFAGREPPVSVDESLGRHTTFRIGGNADFFCVPATVTQLTRILELCRQYQVRTYLLGNGSNTLFSDAGFGGAVLS